MVFGMGMAGWTFSKWT